MGFGLIKIIDVKDCRIVKMEDVMGKFYVVYFLIIRVKRMSEYVCEVDLLLNFYDRYLELSGLKKKFLVKIYGNRIVKKWIILLWCVGVGIIWVIFRSVVLCVFRLE